MPDFSSDPNSFNIDGMLGAFFGNVSQRVFGGMGKDIGGLEEKFKRMNSAAVSGFASLRSGADRVGDAIAGINRRLREQADRIRNMPRMRPPPQTTTGPRRHDERDPETGRYIPRRRGWGWGRGGGGDGFGGTRFGSRFSPGGGLGGVSAFGGLGSIGVLFGGASAARGFGRFDANLATLQAEAGLNQEQRSDVTGKILDIAGSTQFNTDEVSSTLIAMVKDGIALTDALNQVPNVLRLAVAESTDLESAWTAMRGFVQSTNSEWEDSVRLSDMMSNATSLSAAKLRDLQDVASRGLTAHSSLDAFSTEGFLAITGILKSLNISNEVIGTGMRQFGTTIARATEGGLTPAAMEALQARGIQFERGMTEVEALKEIQAGVEGMADTELKNFFHEVFGERAKKVFENIIPKVDELEQKMELIRKKGTVNEKFEVHAKSLTNQFKLLTSAADSLIKKFMMILNEGNAFGDGIGWVTGKITQLTTFMESNKATIQAWWGNFQEILGGLFNLVSTGVEKAADFWNGLSEGEKTIVAIGAVIGAFVLGPVTGLIAAGALIIAKWDEIKDFFSRLWDGMDEPVMGFIKVVSDGTMSVINWVRRQWDEMSPYFKKIFQGVGFVVSNTWKAISAAAGVAWEGIKIVWKPVSAWFRLLWEGVKLAATIAWEGIKVVIKGAVLFVEGAWNTLKAIFNWKPVKVVRSAFGQLVGFFRDLIVKLKQPFQDFMDFVAGIFNKIADGIAKIRGWFSRGEDGKMRVTVEVEEPEALKVDLPPVPVQQETPQLPTDATETQKKVEPTFYETKAVKTPSTPAPVKPTSSYEDFVKAEKENRRAIESRRVDAGLGKLEMRGFEGQKPRDFASKVNRSYMTREAYDQRKADAATLAMRRDETQRFGADRQTILTQAHTFEGQNRADLSRVQLFDKLQREFPKIFEKFYAPDVEKSPVIPEVVLSGDEFAFTQWIKKLTGRMERQAAREKTPSTYTALGGFDKGGITADRLMNRERDRKKALEELEATRVIRFPKLDDAQYQDLSQMFRSGFLSLVDVNSAILSEMQAQTRLMGGTVDPSKPVVRKQGDAVFDDMIAKRLAETQEMAGIVPKETVIPEIQPIVNVETTQPPAPVVNIQPQAPASTDLVVIPETSGPREREIAPEVTVALPPAPVTERVQPTPPVLDIAPPTEREVSLPSAPQPLPPPQATTEHVPEISLETPAPPVADSGVPPVTVNLEQPATLKNVGISPEASQAPSVPVVREQPATLKDLGIPEFELPDINAQVEAPSPPVPITPSISTERPIASPQVEVLSPEMPIITAEMQDVAAPHVPMIEPQMDSRFEELLESGLRLSERSEPEGERVTATGQRVEVGGSRTTETGGITIEKIEIHATSETSAREIARAVLQEFERERRTRNFN